MRNLGDFTQDLCSFCGPIWEQDGIYLVMTATSVGVDDCIAGMWIYTLPLQWDVISRCGAMVSTSDATYNAIP